MPGGGAQRTPAERFPGGHRPACRPPSPSARNTSRTRPDCGHTARENRVTQADFTCASCGFTADADHVGAMNVINRAGLVPCAGGLATGTGSPRPQS
ncbi:zinc ribbon domain-containing protein [Streptomyces sp. enrichment culture]|uniref:zinc ribbon domain-containing protein n=1 Tax=Streptomyces sp. enrichment culture TaxID=1795815 RepID=UPI003F544221